jgi:hypothetical protein
MFGLLIIVAAVLSCFPIGMLIARLWDGYDMYQRSIKAFGKDKVRLIFKPLTFYNKFCLANTHDGYDSQRMFTKEMEKNPDIQVFVVVTANMGYLFLADPDIIKKLCFDHTK